MSHLSHEALWALASKQGTVDAQAHVDACAQCKEQLAKVAFAQSMLLKPRPEAPPLSDVSARRIGNVLAEAAEAQAMKNLGWRGWWAWRPLLFAVAAALLLFVFWPARVAAPLPPVALPTEPEHKAGPVVEAQGVAQVTSARKAKADDTTLAKNQSLKAGSKVSTEAGGALWLELPDGTRAGLSSQSEVMLEAMGNKRVALEVKKGNLIVVAKHDPARELRVYAGEVEVRDLGTRFLVAREERKVAVAVEEGEVEVRVGEKVTAVRAGQGVEIARGRMRELPLAPPMAPVKVEKPKPSTEPGTEVAMVKPPVEDLPPTPKEQATDAGASASASSVPDAGKGLAAVVGTPPPEEPLESIGSAFKKFGEALARPFIPTRAMLADRIDGLATEGRCDDAEKEGREWLGRDGGSALEEVQLRHSVLRARLRCLTRTGKQTEADEVRKQLPP